MKKEYIYLSKFVYMLKYLLLYYLQNIDLSMLFTYN